MSRSRIHRQNLKNIKLILEINFLFYFTANYSRRVRKSTNKKIGLNNETIRRLFYKAQDYRLLWDNAQSNSTDNEQKAVTWNTIRKSVELPGLCQIKATFSDFVRGFGSYVKGLPNME